MIKILWMKTLILVVLFACTFGLSLLPLKLSAARSGNGYSDSSRRRRFWRTLSVLNCYAAGVFLATCLLALFPNVKSKLVAGLDALNASTPFPLAEFIIVFGLFLILLVEQLIISAQGHGRVDGHVEDVGGHVEDVGAKPLLPAEPDETPDSPITAKYHRINERITIHNHGNEENVDGSKRRDRDHPQNWSDDEVNKIEEDSDVDDHHHHHKHTHDGPQSFLRAMVLLFALSLHSLFEGLALGLQRDASMILQIFAALILHKSILAFSVGVNLVQSGIKTSTIVKSNLLFAVTSPVGIGIGMLVIDLTRNYAASMLVNAVLQGLASGTFLFVVFFEILPHEFSHESKLTENRGERLLKLLFLILGYSTICVLIIIFPEEMHSKHLHT